MKIEKVRRSGKRIEVVYSDRNQKTMQVFETEQDFDSWKKIQKYIATAEIIAICIIFGITLFLSILILKFLTCVFTGF